MSEEVKTEETTVQTEVEATPELPKNAKIFIGKSEVTDLTLDQDTELVQASLSDNRKFTLTMEQYESLRSAEPYDDGMVSFRKWKPVIDRILDILERSNMQLNDKEFVLGQIDSSIVSAHRRALCKLYNIENLEHISLTMIEKVLTGSETQEKSA